MKTTPVLAVVGTIGAGKDTAAEIILANTNFVHLSLSDIVRDETKKQGLEQHRDNWRTVANALRAVDGNGILAQKMVAHMLQHPAAGFVITSVRHPDEVTILRDAYPNFFLLAIDAPVELRYQRITGRGKIADNVSFEEFVNQEEKENVSTDIGMRIREVIAMADHTIMNAGTKKQLITQISSFLSSISLYKKP